MGFFFSELYPLDEIKLAKFHTKPRGLPSVAWNPWTDLRERDDVKSLNVSFPFGPIPEHFQVTKDFLYGPVSEHFQITDNFHMIIEWSYTSSTIVIVIYMFKLSIFNI